VVDLLLNSQVRHHSENVESQRFATTIDLSLRGLTAAVRSLGAERAIILKYKAARVPQPESKALLDPVAFRCSFVSSEAQLSAGPAVRAIRQLICHRALISTATYHVARRHRQGEVCKQNCSIVAGID
jgi:hypothetical protein